MKGNIFDLNLLLNDNEISGEHMKSLLSRAILPVTLGLVLGAPGAMAQVNTSGSDSDQYSQTDDAKRAEAYYNFTMGHLSEEQYELTGRSEIATQAIDYYKKALALDPGAPAIIERLAETYAKSQRIRDAVLEAQNALKADPNNLAAHRLLARIYIRTLGDLDASAGQRATINRAVEQ